MDLSGFVSHREYDSGIRSLMDHFPPDPFSITLSASLFRGTRNVPDYRSKTPTFGRNMAGGAVGKTAYEAVGLSYSKSVEGCLTGQVFTVDNG